MNSYYEKFTATGEVKCIDEEISFEIPQGWEWCRLGTIAEIIGGYAFPSLMLKGDTGTRVIRISDFTEHGLTNSRIVRYNGAAISDLYTIQLSDILMAMTGGTVGKSCYIKSLPEKLLLNQRVAVIRNQYMNSEYINLIVEAPHIIAFVNDKKNSTNDNISMKDIYNFLVPIPSIKQQKRIVDAFNDIRPIIKRFTQGQENKERLQNEIKNKLRKSILQEAIQGNLVPQISEEGTAQDFLQEIKNEKLRLVKEGKLKKSALSDSVIFKGDDNKYYEKVGKSITDISEQIPFDIPDSWQWTRFATIANICIGKTPPRGEQKYWSNGKYNWVAISDMKDGEEIIQTKEKVSEVAANKMFSTISTKGSLIMSFKLTVGRTSILGIDAYHNEAIVTINPYVDENYNMRNFLLKVLPLITNFGESKDAIKGKTLNSKSLATLLIPLPPLEEQKRIVDKIELSFQHLK